MAEKILQTRILMKVDTLENWNSSTLALKKGELAFATVAADAGVGLSEPVVMVKIGTEEEKTFKDLPWAFHAKASDVLAACKTEDGLKAFVNGVIADAGIATNTAMEALAGRVTTAEGKITTLEGEMDTVEAKAAANEAAITALQGLVGDTKVATQISNAIAALDLANTYEAKGEAAKVQTALDTYKTSNDAAVLANKNSAQANADAITLIKDGTTIDSFADVESALAGKQAAGDYATKAEAQGYADAKDEAIADAKKAGTDAATAAKAAQDDVDALELLVGGTKVSEQISTAITNLDLDNTYDAKGDAAAAEAAAKGHADSLNTAMDTRVKAVEAKAHEHANKTVLDGITAEKVAAWDAAEQNAKDHADGLDEVMDGRVAALEAKFTGDDSVADQITDAVAAEAKLREDGDKALQDQITANDGELDALRALVGDTKVSDAIATAVAAEKERAEGIEGGLETRLAAVEGDYLKAADKTELEGKIKSNADAIELLTNGVDSDTVDGVNDLIQYVKDHGTEVTGIKADIKTNADDIDALEGRMDTAEGAIATKAAQADLEALAGRVSTVEGDLNTETTGLKARMTAAEADIDALETKVGDETVAAQIEAAIEALKIGDYAKAADLTAAINQHNTDKAALEAEIAKKANTTDLHAIATSGNVNDLVQTEGDVLVFDCGGSV